MGHGPERIAEENGRLKAMSGKGAENGVGEGQGASCLCRHKA